MKPYVVLDTNILLDLFYFADQRVKRLEELLLNHEIQAVTNNLIWEELDEVLKRPPFNQSDEKVLQIRKTKENLFIWKDISASSCGVKCVDPDDQIFVELSVQIAPCFLITKDNHLLRMKKRLDKLGVQVMEQYPST
jgi:predicted nucleic acid-binding protein